MGTLQRHFAAQYSTNLDHLPTRQCASFSTQRRTLSASRNTYRLHSHILCASGGSDIADQTPPEQPSQPLRGSFVRAPLISYEKRTRPCRICQGSGTVPCATCNGKGKLAKGGYHAKNPINATRVVGSKWTALQRTFGWRHFQCSQKRKEGKDTFVMLTATCDGDTQLWINIKNLKDRQRWASGWLQKRDIRALENEELGAECKGCSATGLVECPICSLAGKIVEL